VGLIGRSNVGKSSLLNALLGRPGIARISATPGKTRALNVFKLPGFYLVDLPGYGYARGDKKSRTEIQAMLTGYLRNRPTIAGIVWLLDIRHQPSPEDEQAFARFGEQQHPVLAVLTKADKLAHGARAKQSRELAAVLGLEGPGDQQPDRPGCCGAGGQYSSVDPGADMRRLAFLAALALAACAPAARGQDSVDVSAGDIPPGMGTLSQDDIALVMRLEELEIRVVPLDERVLKLLTPDTYRSLHDLAQQRGSQIDSVSRQNGVSLPGGIPGDLLRAAAGRPVRSHELEPAGARPALPPHRRGPLQR
jgi:GTP-binding protein